MKMKLVPAEPTEEMLSADSDWEVSNDLDYVLVKPSQYATMFAAAHNAGKVSRERFQSLCVLMAEMQSENEPSISATARFLRALGLELDMTATEKED